MSLYDREGNDYCESKQEFYEQQKKNREEIKSDLQTALSCWVENEMEAGKVPQLEQFRDHYPNFDVEEFYEIIADAIKRLMKMFHDEKRWDSLPF